MLIVLLLEVCRVLTEIISFKVFRALDLLVVVLTLCKSLLELDLFGLKALHLLHLNLLFLLDALSLGPVDGKLVVSLLGLDLAIKSLALSLQSILIRR